MADRHEALIRSFRKRVITRGLKDAKSPMPTFRPDIFAEKVSGTGLVVEQIAVEAEIESTLFSEHTSHQLILLDDFMRHQTKKRIRVRGFLLVPRGKSAISFARSVLSGLFPEGTGIQIVQAA